MDQVDSEQDQESHAEQDGSVRDYFVLTGPVEGRSGDCDPLVGCGEEGLERVHHAGGVESSQIDERVPDLTILPILTSTFSTRQYSPPQVRVSKPNFKKILQ